MQTSEDTTRTSMSYMDHLRGVVLAGVALVVEKTRTYGPSWKRRGGAGAWFTTVRPWDRLETIVDRHGGDVFAAVAADPSGSDGSALACIRDVRNYLMLIEAEMVARGTVPLPTHEQMPIDASTELYMFVSSRWPNLSVGAVSSVPREHGGLDITISLGAPVDARSLIEGTELLAQSQALVERQTDAARDRGPE